MAEPIISIKNITKEYPGTIALKDVNVDIYPGEVHTIAGENGAGKSTLMKVLAGAIEPTKGEVFIHGEQLKNFSPKVSSEKGIGIIYQEFNLVPHLTVEENIMLGNEQRKGLFVKRKENLEIAEKVLDRIQVRVSPKTLVKDLGVADQQLVEIAKAISKDVQVLIMDEPTAALTSDEVRSLFQLMNELRDKNVAIIYISHKFDEMFEISDKVTVLRDGVYIGTENIEDLDENKLVKMMVGRELQRSQRESAVQETTIMEVRDLSSSAGIADISFDLHKGEILGIAGLLGSGRTELAKTIFGVHSIEKGTIKIKDVTHSNIKSPEHAYSLGIGLIPEDRKHEGLVLDHSCEDNINLPSVKQYSKGLFINRGKEKEIVSKYGVELKIKYHSGQLGGELSGGNQQKLVVAKTLATDADILIFDEPTRGVDIGAKQEIYNLMNGLLKKGKSIIMISSEMEEVINMSDRIMVMMEGKSAGILQKEEATQERIFELATGIANREEAHS